MFVAQQFTGREGRYVPVQETVSGFKKILAGDLDDVGEQSFYMAGNIDEVLERARNTQG
jgi:F-type H+-transporting ATPase subunit beta